MRREVDVIVQPPLAHGRVVGRADVLLRVLGESALDDYTYEPVDAIKRTRNGTISTAAKMTSTRSSSAGSSWGAATTY